MKPPCKNPCKNVFRYAPSLIGKNADKTKIMFVLNRPTEVIAQTHLFSNNEVEEYKNALLKSKTGQILRKIQRYCNLDQNLEDIYLTNLFKCTLKDDVPPRITRDPRTEEYEKCFNLLEKQILEFKPEKIVVFGNKPKKVFLTKISNQKNPEYQKIPILFSSHPSYLWAKRRDDLIYGKCKSIISFLSH